jgi:hypothetical protein
MRLCMIGAAAALGMILAVIFWRGIGALSIEMITQPPRGSFYLGGGGGIANAIVGSLLLAIGRDRSRHSAWPCRWCSTCTPTWDAAAWRTGCA